MQKVLLFFGLLLCSSTLFGQALYHTNINFEAQVYLLSVEQKKEQYHFTVFPNHNQNKQQHFVLKELILKDLEHSLAQALAGDSHSQSMSRAMLRATLYDTINTLETHRRPILEKIQQDLNAHVRNLYQNNQDLDSLANLLRSKKQGLYAAQARELLRFKEALKEGVLGLNAGNTQLDTIQGIYAEVRARFLYATLKPSQIDLSALTPFLKKDNQENAAVSSLAADFLKEAWTTAVDQLFVKKDAVIEQFGEDFLTYVEGLQDDESTLTTAQKQFLVEEAQRIFYEIQLAELNAQYSADPAGILQIVSMVDIHAPKKQVRRAKRDSSELRTQDLVITDVDIEFAAGFMENIRVSGYIDGSEAEGDSAKVTLRFENTYPIGMTSLRNFEQFKYKKLYLKSIVPSKAGEEYAMSTEQPFYILLGDVLDYEGILKNNRRDYSPKDSSYQNLQVGSYLLRKARKQPLFETRIFTDLVGFQQERPNGIAQLEVSKPIRLNSSRKETFSGLSGLYNNFGFVQYIRPTLSLTKLEEHNKFLTLQRQDSILLSIDNGDTTRTLSTTRSLTGLDVVQYTNLALGVDLNLFVLDNPSRQYTIFFDLGFQLGRTAVRDSLQTIDNRQVRPTGSAKTLGLTTLQFAPQLRVAFFPKEPFSIGLSLRPMWTFIASDEVEAATSWLNRVALDLQYKLNTHQRLFFRYTLTHEFDALKTNFSQAQLGYAFYFMR